MHTLYMIALCLVMLACSGPRGGGGGGGGGVELDAATDATPDTAPALVWSGTWDAAVASMLTTGDGMVRTSSSTEAVPTTADGPRWTWERSGPCTIRWTLDGATARADAGQRCTVDAGGSRVTLELRAGDATLAGATFTATLRWSLDAAAYVETITARRRP